MLGARADKRWRAAAGERKSDSASRVHVEKTVRGFRFAMLSRPLPSDQLQSAAGAWARSIWRERAAPCVVSRISLVGGRRETYGCVSLQEILTVKLL